MSEEYDEDSYAEVRDDENDDEENPKSDIDRDSSEEEEDDDEEELQKVCQSINFTYKV